jgi:hypothetical protein
MVPPLLNVVDFAHRLLGPSPLQYISSRLNKASNHLIPEWNPYMPKVRSSRLTWWFLHVCCTPCSKASASSGYT